MSTKLNRGIVRDTLRDFLGRPMTAEFNRLPKNVQDAYKAGAQDFAEAMKKVFEGELNIHLSKDGSPQQRYRFHYKVGVLATSVEKWMTREEAESYAAKKGYRLELVRTTHKSHA